MPLRIVVAVHDPPVWTIPPADVRRIAEALPGVEVVDVRTPEGRRREFPAADVLLATRLTDEEARLATRLRWIQSSAVGVGGVLVPDVVARDIVVTNARGLHADYLAEHAIALALAVRRRLHVAGVRQQDRTWAQQELETWRHPSVGRSRLLVVGLGEIGGRVARMAAGLGFRVAGIRRHPERGAPAGGIEVHGPEALDAQLALADVVVLAVPRTKETRTLLGAREFAIMRPHAVLVNVARGRLVDEEALARALASGQIGGAGLDAFVREPLPPDDALWNAPNVLISPHTGAFGGDYWAPVVDLFLDNVRRFVRGEPLENLVDKGRGY